MAQQQKAPRPESLDGFEFQAWPKTARLFRDIVVTEKLDGTNAAIHISEDGRVAAQSRNRLITPEHDNYGFARWVHENAAEIADVFGPGLHFGEFWGRGIGRKYGLEKRRFSLFNTAAWRDLGGDIGGVWVDSVPVLYEGVFDETEIRQQLYYLQVGGSKAAPGFMNPEGICVYHTQTRQVMKVTLDNADAGKWEAAA
ncbi:RNA ligase family protein [Streptomyces hydrogenans]|uniref:RNA ligase family protein n=1 Tax=Streptomyces hydrogenans TaxID=1873719 RepID=UPI0035DF6F96